MFESFAWGVLAGSSLVLGGVVAFLIPTSRRALGLVMAFGAEVLNGGKLVGVTTFGFALAFAISAFE